MPSIGYPLLDTIDAMKKIIQAHHIKKYMKLTLKFLLILLTIDLVGGCAAESFVRPDDDSLTLGLTSYQSIIAQMGEPTKKMKQAGSDRSVKVLEYFYTPRRGKPAYPGVIPERKMTLYFMDHLLIGYLFRSTLKDDYTDFDEAMIKQLEKGTSTQNDVIEIMGKPAGVLTFPLILEGTDREISYFYEQRKGSSRNRYLKFLRVSLTKKRVVMDIEYFTMGTK